jgi:hypothetical protein
LDFRILSDFDKRRPKDGKKLKGIYQVPPDLFVRELTRDCIEKTISDLLDIDDLEKVLNPSIFNKADQPNELPIT